MKNPFNSLITLTLKTFDYFPTSLLHQYIICKYVKVSFNRNKTINWNPMNVKCVLIVHDLNRCNAVGRVNSAELDSPRLESTRMTGFG